MRPDHHRREHRGQPRRRLGLVRWTVPASGTYRFDTCSANPGVVGLIGLFIGNSVSNLTEFGAGPSQDLCPPGQAGGHYHHYAGSRPDVLHQVRRHQPGQQCKPAVRRTVLAGVGPAVISLVAWALGLGWRFGVVPADGDEAPDAPGRRGQADEREQGDVTDVGDDQEHDAQAEGEGADGLLLPRFGGRGGPGRGERRGT
jgi:hypothetical protein